MQRSVAIEVQSVTCARKREEKRRWNVLESTATTATTTTTATAEGKRTGRRWIGRSINMKNEKEQGLRGAPGIATRNKDATRGS